MSPFRPTAAPVHARRVAASLAIIAGLLAGAVPADAQLLSEEVQDSVRLCRYVGSDTDVDGQVVPRTFTVGAGQSCPPTAPFRDPNTPVPPNAMLTGERTGASRICLYEEGGLEYQISVDLALRCAMTPALLDRALAQARDQAR